MNLDPMFYPDSVAVIGASDKEGKVGNAIMKSLDREFGGKIYPVNLEDNEVLGYKAYKSVSEIDSDVDMAVVAIPAKYVPDLVKECGEKGIYNMVVVSAGFSEAGREDLENEVKKYSDEYDINIIGPNCLGVYNPEIGLDTIFNPPERQARPDKGRVAFLSQSGAFGAAILDWFSEVDIGVSKFVSYGNRADIDEADLIDYLNDDEETEVITYYIEGIKDGRKFMKAAERCDKPIIALKSGRTSEGSSAASSHTASLAGKDGVYKGAFKQSRVIRVYSLRELFNLVKSISCQPPSQGSNISIVTNGGGAGVMTTDALVDIGLNLASFTKTTRKKFKESVKEGKIPEHATTQNPVDIIGDAPSERYQEAMRIVLADDNTDGLIVICLFQSPALDEDIVEKISEMQEYEKPIICVAPGGEYTHKITAKIEDEGIPVYQTPEEAVEAIWGLAECGKCGHEF